jgi:hypothetical protein
MVFFQLIGGIMEKLTLSTLSSATLKRWVNLQEYGIAEHDWLNVDAIVLSKTERRQLHDLKLRLQNSRLLLMNEATIWARGIYPLLTLAEQGSIQAWSGVALHAVYSQFELDGIADGVLGKCVSGVVESPYLIVVEAKRGLEAANPIYQLYGQLLAAAHLNWENDQQDPQEIFGCYTVADNWSFVRAEVVGLTADKPTLRIESSREYSEQARAFTIVKILKRIVAKYP